jgi:nitroimidazol reductase NimA-like FMN-containing flavoprotein (pyridoxamine 5'-phosphate oxidase superfamily)
MTKTAMTQPDWEAFLAEPRIGVLSVASDDGRPPLAVPVWHHYEPGGELTFFTGTQGRTARKTRLIERAEAISFNVQQSDPPYKFATIEGRLVGVERPPSHEQMLAIVRRYLPEEMAQGFVEAELADPGPTLFLFRIRPERWLTADFS